MRNVENWDSIQERQPGEFDSPVPGGYIAKIITVTDDESKEYLKIEWDFAEGEYTGSNAETFNRAGFWPTTLYRSYKEKALGFFKAFKTSVEMSNRGYAFDCSNPKGLEGKLMGVVLGEEEYIKSSGEPGKRLYVHQVRSVKAIQDGAFEVPKLKRADRGQDAAPAPVSPGGDQFAELADDDGDLPF